MSIIIWVIVLLVLALVYVIQRAYLRMLWLSMKLPGPPALPIIGNGLLFLNKSANDIFKALDYLCTSYRGICRVWIGPELNILMSDPKDIEVLLSSSKYIEKSEEYHMIRPWLNEGLLLSKGKKWFQRRKILTPAFHFKILDQFVEIFDRQSNTFVDILSKLPNTNQVELYPLVTLCALDVICEAAMGTSINAQQHSDSTYVMAVKEIAYVVHQRMMSFLMRMDFFFKWSSIAKSHDKAIRVLHDFTEKVIRERREELVKKEFHIDANQNDMGIKERSAFLDILLQATIEGLPLSDLDIREEVDTFMFEGHDTTTSGITFCLYMLAKNPEIQQRCFYEVEEVLGTDKTRPATLTDLNNLSYLELVIKETLRMFPSVPLVGRYLREETTINGNTFPAGCQLIVPIYFIGHDPALFPEPEEFRPERFGEDRDTEKQNPFAYVPFSAGPRNCIGQKFAMLEMKSLVSKILRHFQLSLCEDSRHYPALVAELVLKPDSKINFTLSPRIYKF